MTVSKKGYIPAIIFLSLFVITIGVMIFLAIRLNWIKEEMVQVESTIVSITRYGDDDHIVMIEYTYKSVLYSGKYNIYTSDMREGDTILIYVNPENPSTFYSASTFLHIILPGIFAVIFAAIGFPLYIYVFKINKIKKNMIQHGRKKIGVITEVKTNYNYTMSKGRHRSYRTHIIVSVIDDYTLQEVKYKSRGFWGPSDLGVQIGVTEVDVWMDRDHKKVYYVDTDKVVNQSIQNK